MRILYLHPAGSFGGASKSLIELFKRLQAKGVHGVVLTPKGTASRAFTEAGMDVRFVRGLSQFDNTQYGHYRSTRWIILLRELFLLPPTLFALLKLRNETFDLIHVNEVTLLPIGVLAKQLLGIPMIVHVRSLQRKHCNGWRSRWINKLLNCYADAVVAIDHTVAKTLAGNLPLFIVHNGINLPVQVSAPASAKRGISDPVCVGFLGVLIPLKGVYELVEAMRILKKRNVQIECLVAGEDARDLSGLKGWVLQKLGLAWSVRVELEKLIERYSLHNHVRLLGFVSDVRTIYPRLDILCFPSYLDAAGRPVFEAAFYGVPSVVAVIDPMPDAILHEVTGLAISKPDPVLIADALQCLTEDVGYRQQLGLQAREWANKIFSIESNASSMYCIYMKTLSKRSIPKLG